MLGRFFGLDGLLTFLGLFICGAAIATVAGAPGWAVPLAGLGTALTLFLHTAVWIQDYLVAYHVEKGNYDRALELGARILEAAPTKRMRERARAELGLMQLARGDHKRAREHFERSAKAPLKPLEKALVEGHLACALAHLGEELERAEELATRALKIAEDDEFGAIFGYFVGLVALKRGDAAKGRELIEASLARDPDDLDPSPGERRFMLAQACSALGDEAAARAALEHAARVTPPGHFSRLAAAAVAPAPAPASPTA